MRSRAHIALVLAGACFVPAALAWSCGLESVGVAPEPPPPKVEAGLEASLPPKGDASVPEDADVEAAVEAGVSCPAGKGPAMIIVDVPGGARFCIDSSEVTNDDYAAFIAATDGGSPNAGVPKSWPLQTCATFTTSFLREYDSGTGVYPAAGMSWCSAYAYCEWAGKRLCRSPSRDAAAGEWWGACSAFGAKTYPYADAYAPATCNDSAFGTAPVKAFPACKGGVPGALFDMSGNVNEHVDSCTEGGSCYAQGGDYTIGAAASCSFAFDTAATSGSPITGIRCCADLK